MEDEARQELGVPRVVCENEDVFSGQTIGIASEEGYRLHY